MDSAWAEKLKYDFKYSLASNEPHGATLLHAEVLDGTTAHSTARALDLNTRRVCLDAAQQRLDHHQQLRRERLGGALALAQRIRARKQQGVEKPVAPETGHQAADSDRATYQQDTGKQKGPIGNTQAVEERMAPDGHQYTRAEFQMYYGSHAEWDAGKQPEKRMGPDGQQYTRAEFQMYYAYGSHAEWDAAWG